MMTTRWLGWVARGLSLVLVLGMAATAAAQGQGGGQMGPRGMGPGGPGGPGGPPMMGGGSALRLVMQLNISDEQRAKIRELMEAQRQSSQSLHQQLRQAQQQLIAAIYGSSGNVEEIAANLATLQAQQFEADVKLQQAIALLLTPDQCQQLVQMASRQGPPPPPPLH